MEERAILTRQLEEYKHNLDVTYSPQQLEQLENEIEVISAHITDLQQKILDSDQGNVIAQFFSFMIL